MAVKTKPASPSATPIRSYLKRYNQWFMRLTIFMQIVTTIIVGGALLVTNVFSADSIAFWMVLITVCVGSIGVNLIIYQLATEPIRNVFHALVHTAGEPTTSTPPNPNDKSFAKTGLKEVLQHIYELSANRDKQTTQLSPTDTVALEALDNMSGGFVILDKNHQVVYANKSAPVRDNTAGQKELELIFLNEQSLQDWLVECENKLNAEKLWMRIANKLPGEEGREFYDVTANYQKGSSAQTVLTLFKRTDVYMPEEEDLDFIAFAAHELRGPLTVIRGYLDVLSEEIGPQLAPDQAILIDRLTVSASRLSGYVNNILNASRYDRRHLKIHLHEESIANIYSSIADDMQMRATAQNRLLNVSIPANLPSVAADASSISEVMANLIDNAIKYSFEGGVVTVSGRVYGDFVEISVEDKGIGIPANVIKNLFHKFYRSHRSRETVGGTGIGLYITKAMVESHGGTISVRSQEGEGSVFSFTLPIYATVADKLTQSNQLNEDLISQGAGWIKNHSMYRG